jgi:hypothetical protein
MQPDLCSSLEELPDFAGQKERGMFLLMFAVEYILQENLVAEIEDPMAFPKQTCCFNLAASGPHPLL